MALSSNPIGCLLCNTTGVLPIPQPTPTQQPFAFLPIPNPLTCDPVTLDWSYNGPREQFTLVISQSHPFKIQSLARMAKVRRDTTSFLVADGLEATVRTFTWPLVNVPTGSYVLQATGTEISVMSDEFFIGGTNTSCLDALPPPAPSFTTSTPISTIPTSELFITTAYTGMPGGTTPLPSVMSLNSSLPAANTKQTDGIVGGLVGAAVFFAAAFAVYRIRRRRTSVLRHPIFLKRSRECSQQDSGTTSRSLPNASASPVDDEKTDYDRPQSAVILPSSPSAASISGSSDTGGPSATTPAMDPEVESHRGLALSALNANTSASPARSPTSPLSPSSASDSRSSLRTQRPRYAHTPAALDLSTPNSSARSQQSSFASWPATASPVPSSATSQMYRGRENGRSSQWVTVGSLTEGADSMGTTIVQARRAVMPVTAGEMRAVRRDFPETPFPLSPDYR